MQQTASPQITDQIHHSAFSIKHVTSKLPHALTQSTAPPKSKWCRLYDRNWLHFSDRSQQLGIFARLWQIALELYDDLVGLDWRWQSVDGAMTKAPLGGESTGKNPTDRAKSGTKRSLLTEAAGIPTGLAVGGANVHDIRLLRTTLRDALMRSRDIHCGVKEHLCMDKGYDSVAVRNMVENVFDYIPHVRTRGEEKKSKRNSRQRARRWVVERTHSWMNRFRAILVRWDKKLSNNIAGLHLACAYITFKRSGVFG